MKENSTPSRFVTENLEPRVAKLETGLEILTRDVTSLAQVVREQSTNLEHEVQKLAVAVTQASGPRKTDWQTILSAIMLIMAIGSAVFWPLNQTAQNNKTDLQALTLKFEDHQKLNLHPVGSALLGRLEDQLKIHIANNVSETENDRASIQKQFELLDEKLQREFSAADKALEHRVHRLESSMEQISEADIDELRAWRNKASGLSSPDSVTPLMPRDGKHK